MSQTLRPTIAIDLDMLKTARERAETRGESLGKVVLDMIRKSLALRAPVPEYRNGIKRLPWRNFTRKVSIEDVNVLLNEPE